MTSKDIKEYGLSIGYSKVGITSADGFPEYVQEVLSRGDHYHFFTYTTANPIQDAIPKNIMPEAKSIIVLVWDYFQKDYPEELKKMIGKAYLGRCYNPIPGSLPYARFQLMKDYLEANGTDSAAIERCLAAANKTAEEKTVVFDGKDFFVDRRRNII